MGTNYYWHDRPCEHCGRVDVIHVCKSLRTWRGHRTAPMNADYPEWGTDTASPFGFDVVSVADWRRVLTERPGVLVDEYGRRVNDPVVWLGEATPPVLDAEAQRWLDKDIAAGRGWLDTAGHRFYDGEFS